MSDATQRFNAKWKADANGCHVWTAAKNKGYGIFTHKGRTWRAHRWALRFIAGVELLEGLQCDHLCNNPSCVNPAHIRQCSHIENLMAPHSNTTAKVASEKTHCKRGHELSGVNLLTQRDGTRRCAKCDDLYNAKRRSKRTPQT